MDDLIRVALADNQMEADIMISALKAEGIRAIWRATNFGVGSGLPVGAVFGTASPVEILALTADAERAHKLLHPTDEPSS
jgi:hypothetical protein